MAKSFKEHLTAIQEMAVAPKKIKRKVRGDSLDPKYVSTAKKIEDFLDDALNKKDSIKEKLPIINISSLKIPKDDESTREIFDHLSYKYKKLGWTDFDPSYYGKGPYIKQIVFRKL